MRGHLGDVGFWLAGVVACGLVEAESLFVSTRGLV